MPLALSAGKLSDEAQKLIILLKVNIEVKCVYNLKELKHLNANAM